MAESGRQLFREYGFSNLTCKDWLIKRNITPANKRLEKGFPHANPEPSSDNNLLAGMRNI